MITSQLMLPLAIANGFDKDAAVDRNEGYCCLQPDRSITSAL